MRLVPILLFVALSAPAQYPWPTISPERAGLDAARLEALRADLAGRGTTALLIIRRGAIVCEWYAEGHDAKRKQGTASLAKAIVGGLSLLAATDGGRIKANDPAARYIAAWKNDPRKSRIEIRHLATHTAGIEDAEQDNIAHEKIPGWKGAFWRREPDPFSIAVTQPPAIFDAGRQFAYSNTGMAALAYAVTASVRGTSTPDLKSLLRDAVMRPIGVPDADWSIGYGRAYDVDGLSLYANWGGGAFTPRATAAIGTLMLQRGQWMGRQVLSRKNTERALADSGLPFNTGSDGANAPASGLGWWVNANGGWTGVPRDAFGGAGAGHQLLMVVPSLDLIVVRNGQALAPRGDRNGFWKAAVDFVLRPAVAAVSDARAYPPSAVIGEVRFAPASSIVRRAQDSDNWPITWGDDGRQYTVYGDGRGFEPRVEKKLSQGFAVVEGDAASFRGVNIRSATGERVGDGAKGLKASGLVMVDGVLYMWVRNAANAQLAWSEDRGRTWQWGFRMERGFGSPAFLNFGANYAGARDNYVYTYSQDGASAYESDDTLLLARAPRTRLRDRAAWEFLERVDDQGRPVWTADVDRRGAVFRYPGHCQRVDALYNAGLKRYLLAVGYGHAGGWGLYEAPEPWGPWSTAFHTEDWGLGKTHGYRLPAKWMAPGGRQMTLVFSGTLENDAFCVRAMELAPVGH